MSNTTIFVIVNPFSVLCFLPPFDLISYKGWCKVSLREACVLLISFAFFLGLESFWCFYWVNFAEIKLCWEWRPYFVKILTTIVLLDTLLSDNHQWTRSIHMIWNTLIFGSLFLQKIHACRGYTGNTWTPLYLNLILTKFLLNMGIRSWKEIIFMTSYSFYQSSWSWMAISFLASTHLEPLFLPPSCTFVFSFICEKGWEEMIDAVSHSFLLQFNRRRDHRSMSWTQIMIDVLIVYLLLKAFIKLSLSK